MEKPTVKDLTPAQCILLTVHYASEANIAALHSFTPSRLDALDPELVLRIVLTYLPESVEPKEYTTYVGEVASRLYLDVDRQDIEVDVSPVSGIDDAHARRNVRRLQLVELLPPAFPPHAPEDSLTRFLCHRAYRIDAETGLLNLVPQLIQPFLDRNDFLRVWYISNILPLLRMNFEYYPQDDCPVSLTDFEKMAGHKGVDFLLSKALEHGAGHAPSSSSSTGNVGRDLKGLVGPWMYGHIERQQRTKEQSSVRPDDVGDAEVAPLTEATRKISLTGVGVEDKTGHDWECAYQWMVHHSQQRFALITHAIEEWDGPADVDLEDFDKGHSFYLDDQVQRKLESQYAQAAFASCYAAQADTEATVRGAHSVLARLAELLDFIPPPDLASSVESLPHVDRHTTALDESRTVEDLNVDALLTPEHPLTTPRMETYMLLQMMVYSAYQFASLGHSISIVSVAKLHFYSSADEQLAVLQKMLKHLSRSGKRDDSQWTADRAKLIWLWNWGIDPEDVSAKDGAGTLGKLEKEDFEEEMLKVFTETSCYNLAMDLIQANSTSRSLPLERAETVILAKAMEAYDGASNGNRTRGGMKKASEIIAAFRPRFAPRGRSFQAAALIAATHALSFYSLTLQHNVPFKPVSIRVSKDPIGLISKVLEQNPRSYTKLDDLVDIGQNFVSAGLFEGQADEEFDALLTGSSDEDKLARQRKDAERRVTFMAIEAALREDDFETAYSYIVNRLTPSTADLTGPRPAKRVKHTRDTSQNSAFSRAEPIEDDISWRAAYLAGRYRPSSSSPPTLRRLEQRTELLSLALLLAPVTALTDILSAWRRCEEETSALQRALEEEEEEFDDRADRRQSAALPGNFTVAGDQPQLILGQKRREMGRMAGSRAAGGGEAETPMSMFDLTRSAARAFSRNVVPLGQASRRSTDAPMESSAESLRPGSGGGDGGDGQQRVRKRDMVANTVSSGLASGLGWVLGATPIDRQQQSTE